MLSKDVFASRVRILEVGYIINITAYYQPAIIEVGMFRDFLRSESYVIAAAVNERIASVEGGHWCGTWLRKAHGPTIGRQPRPLVAPQHSRRRARARGKGLGRGGGATHLAVLEQRGRSCGRQAASSAGCRGGSCSAQPHDFRIRISYTGNTWQVNQ